MLEDGGHKEEQRRIAREVSKLRERARRGPDPDAPRVPQLFTGPALDLDVPVADPYEGIPDPDPATVVRAPALTMAAEHILHAARPAPPPAPDDPVTETETDFEPADASQPVDTGGRVQEPARASRPGVLSLRGGAAEVFGITQPPAPRAAPSLGAGEPGDEEDDGGES